MAKKTLEETGLIYNGRPLARNGRKIYYGSVEDAYYVCMTVNQSEQVGAIDISTDITVDLMKKEAEKNYKKEKTEKCTGIFDAIELASQWLDQAASA